MKADTVLAAGKRNIAVELYDSPIRMDFASPSSPNVPAHQGCLLCCCWEFSKPHTYQCCRRGSVTRGSLTMWHCPVGFITRFQQMTLYPIHVPLGRRYASAQAHGACWGTPAFRLLFCHVSNTSRYFFPLSVGASWQCPAGGMLFSGCPGGLAVAVLCGGCDLWRRMFHS